MNKFKMYGLTVSMAAILGLAGAGVAAHAENSTHNEITIGARQLSASVRDTADGSVADIVEDAMPCMVAITNTSIQELRDYYDSFGGFGGFGGYGSIFDDFFGYGNGGFGNGRSREVEQVYAGSGVIVGEEDDSYLIATNAHVVSGAKELSVAFIDDATAPAEIVGASQANDLAIIRVKKSDLEDETEDMINVIRFGSADDLRVGEDVIAIGNALGYGQSVSKGIISALDRTIRTYDEESGRYVQNEGMIQTDASINPGNSGGALLNMKGELIGINSAKFTNTQIEGMGYAISIATAEPVLTDLANGKDPYIDTSKEGWATDYSSGVKLGVTCYPVTEEMAEQYDVPVGIYVQEVEPVSAAADAGIRSGDIITELNGQAVTTLEELKDVLADCEEGDTVEATIRRFASDAFGSTVYQDVKTEITFSVEDEAEDEDEDGEDDEEKDDAEEKDEDSDGSHEAA